MPDLIISRVQYRQALLPRNAGLAEDSGRKNRNFHHHTVAPGAAANRHAKGTKLMSATQK
jgi:hypothetical protein